MLWSIFLLFPRWRKVLLPYRRHSRLEILVNLTPSWVQSLTRKHLTASVVMSTMPNLHQTWPYWQGANVMKGEVWGCCIILCLYCSSCGNLQVVPQTLYFVFMRNELLVIIWIVNWRNSPFSPVLVTLWSPLLWRPRTPRTESWVKRSLAQCCQSTCTQMPRWTIWSP